MCSLSKGFVVNTCPVVGLILKSVELSAIKYLIDVKESRSVETT